MKYWMPWDREIFDWKKDIPWNEPMFWFPFMLIGFGITAFFIFR
jgi:hypothetical protein